MIKDGTTYEFNAFPATYWSSDKGTRYNPKGYRFGCWSIFTYTTLAAAQKEVRRLKRIRKLYKRDPGSQMDGDMVIFKVTRSKVE